MTVRCYAFDGVLIDAGISPFRRRILAFARERRVRQALLTHHHEDHTGNARALQEAGVRVMASPESRDYLARGFRIYVYQRLAWGPAPRVEVAMLPEDVETDQHRFRVLPAPGHSDDHVVFHEPREGWLFSGDVFIAERIKYFRGDEDFAAAVEALRRLTQLDFDRLFCAHRPVLRDGRAALERKLQYLLEIEGRVRDLAARGYSLRAITRTVLGGEEPLMAGLTAGDVMKRHIIRSILHGPAKRPR